MKKAARDMSRANGIAALGIGQHGVQIQRVWGYKKAFSLEDGVHRYRAHECASLHRVCDGRMVFLDDLRQRSP